MLDWGSAFGDETLTIRIAILENLEMLGRKYQVGHLDENTAFLRFFDSGHFRSFFRPSRVKLDSIQISYPMLRNKFLLRVPKKIKKKF